MKINFIQTLIAISICLLISYGLFNSYDGTNKILLSFGSFVFLASTLAMTIGVNFESPRTTTNIRVVSGVFFFAALAINLFYLFQTNFSTTSYIVLNGVLFLIFILISFSLNKNDH